MVKDREAWHAAVHGVTKSWAQLCSWTTTVILSLAIPAISMHLQSFELKDNRCHCHSDRHLRVELGRRFWSGHHPRPRLGLNPVGSQKSPGPGPLALVSWVTVWTNHNESEVSMASLQPPREALMKTVFTPGDVLSEVTLPLWTHVLTSTDLQDVVV